MKRFVQILVAAIWLVGAVVGGFDVHPSAPVPKEPSMKLVIDTDHARLGVDRDRVVLAVETPWHSDWRVAAPMPDPLVPNRPEDSPRSQSEPDAQPSIVAFVIRSLASLP
jgi:Na+-transporting methylmalonyl-CoA/oxaloacetate decarboxylase gamma subunit